MTRPPRRGNRATPSAAAKAAASQGSRDIGSVIAGLDASSMKDDDLIDMMHHFSSVLNLRKLINNPNASLARSAPSYCYTKAGDSSTVSIWSNGFKVGETSEANAQASGIPPCGG
jgi:hypothetical protein